MNGKPCATADTDLRWEDIDFQQAAYCVRKLQKRIAVAYSNLRFDVVCALQTKLEHSLFAKYIAVKAVASNKGKNTPGSDGRVLITPAEKMELLCSLRRRGYQPKSLRRVYIPKGDGSRRPLSIPTVKDRAMQELYKLALEPIAELTADSCSFAYRPGRSGRDAVAYLGEMLLESKYDWILKTDVQKCFDSISHEWLMENIPMDKVILRKFLEAGFVYHGNYHSIERGVPQGGCISPVLCNMALDGLEDHLGKLFGDSIRLVRYADDIVIVGESERLSVQTVVPGVEKFLKTRGLCLSPEKTKVSSAEEGVTFLGWTIFRKGETVIAGASDRSIDSLKSHIATLESTERYSSAAMKSVIGGWVNYYKWIAPFESLRQVSPEEIEFISYLTGDRQFAEMMAFLLSPLR